jgi:hypothetical protein
MSDIKKIPLISSEIAGLWKSYMSATIIKCMVKSYLIHVESEEIRVVLQQLFDLSNQHIQEVTNLLNKENLPIPNGFSDSDVNINAPRLFTDSFYLQYVGFATRVAMHNYTLILNHVARSDIRAYFSKCVKENVDLFNNSADLRLSMGIFIRAPRVEVPKKVQYVKSQSFIFDWFGEKRPLLTVEITHIFALIFSNIVGRAMATGFGQVSKIKKNSDFFLKAKLLHLIK